MTAARMMLLRAHADLEDGSPVGAIYKLCAIPPLVAAIAFVAAIIGTGSRAGTIIAAGLALAAALGFIRLLVAVARWVEIYSTFAHQVGRVDGQVALAAAIDDGADPAQVIFDTIVETVGRPLEVTRA